MLSRKHSGGFSEQDTKAKYKLHPFLIIMLIISTVLLLTVFAVFIFVKKEKKNVNTVAEANIEGNNNFFQELSDDMEYSYGYRFFISLTGRDKKNLLPDWLSLILLDRLDNDYYDNDTIYIYCTLYGSGFDMTVSVENTEEQAETIEELNQIQFTTPQIHIISDKSGIYITDASSFYQGLILMRPEDYSTYYYSLGCKYLRVGEGLSGRDVFDSLLSSFENLQKDSSIVLGITQQSENAISIQQDFSFDSGNCTDIFFNFPIGFTACVNSYKDSDGVKSFTIKGTSNDLNIIINASEYREYTINNINTSLGIMDYSEFESLVNTCRANRNK